MQGIVKLVKPTEPRLDCFSPWRWQWEYPDGKSTCTHSRSRCVLGIAEWIDSAFPMLERLTQSLPHNNEDHAHVSSSLPHLSMATYRGNEESASDTPDESPQPLRRCQRKRKKDGGAFELVAPSRNEIAHWVCEPWRGLTASTIVGSFKRIDLLDDTRPARGKATDMISEIKPLLEALTDVSLAAPANRRTCVSSVDDIATADEPSDSSESSS
ncbi:hypothetical protein JG688_00017635 [Phytophthora aleatoria]|uniref:Uncharacterized protein n=1 Tax=Phytophthora aleatoria TaxID=2496075 RepID=A0A8J5IQH8_9STRA|nr:hypothetical protein JG688_00017635 [Phytophthora aleatoria]